MTKTRTIILFRLKIFIEMHRAHSYIEWIILNSIPVLSPNIRPILKLERGKILVASINTLYQIVRVRNSRIAQMRCDIKKTQTLPNQQYQYQIRLIQSSIDNIIVGNTN